MSRSEERDLDRLVSLLAGFNLGVEVAHDHNLEGDQGDYMRGARDMAGAILSWIEEPDQAFALIRAWYSDDAEGINPVPTEGPATKSDES